MIEFERKRIEMELKAFVSRDLKKPSDCKNLDQIKFCITVLCQKIEELERQSNYVPEDAYLLYNAIQIRLLHAEFTNSYC